ncbi:exonuclease II Exo2 [Paramarasmius palmivorus]|uniref:5'-3' exoribonuclease 1 n=1 Tax=Paramarasmius palmivorus TaxID=297713 RepID=A0AAW0DV34_9AGAR
MKGSFEGYVFETKLPDGGAGLSIIETQNPAYSVPPSPITMGIPKFFRYVSERYPLTSQLIQENKIPEFDNLYLDFNGIIHNCSHPNDEDAHFRLSEEQIFTSIFAYVDHLFGKIKPKKLFFMAVDGVAPRAKMNQQRSRRFRTAKEAKEVREKAEAKGEKLPDEKAFDSNCITPGTSFMARLSEQLRYFVNKKITEDSNWRNVEVVLSGHEVPGEGEHKIMEYIRLSRAQPDYNPNMRHCLYGLDADLIMLGLLSHDPHFCLLREEVKFGPARKKNNSSLESINFYLLHLSLFREYLDTEFHTIAPSLPFPYSLERIIDDFILLAVFVGNDFLPNLPDLHIHENGLERLFEVYKRVLPTLDGYVNDSGVINMPRLQRILDEMATWEQEVFEREYADMGWFKGKQSKELEKLEQARKNKGLILSPEQRELFEKVKEFVLTKKAQDGEKLKIINQLPARDRTFMATLAEDMNLDAAWDEYDDDDNNLLVLSLPTKEDDESSEDEVAAAESEAAIHRVLNKYTRAPVSAPKDPTKAMNDKMAEWKREYYRSKLEISYDSPEEMGRLIRRYAEGLQWVMHYYFSGVASWGWFYDYHYAPRISDLKGLDTMSFQFDLGKPFKPFEQLMGVLPSASKELVPTAYWTLMTDPVSSISHFYPTTFELDLNGKKQDWEAIVKIPFINEKELLAAMATREHHLTEEERARNSYGTSTRFIYAGPDAEPTEYPSSLPGFFPPLYRCMCKMEVFDLPTLDGLHLVPGLRDGVSLGKNALAGFPSLNTLPHAGVVIGYHHVNVHGTESRNKSVVVNIANVYENRKSEDIARELVGTRVWIGWPFLREGMAVAISDSLFRYEKTKIAGKEKVVSTPHSHGGLGHWKSKAQRIEDVYSKRCGVVTGEVEVLVHVRPLKGLKRLDTGAFIKDYEDQDKETEQALQLCVTSVISEDPRFLERPAPPLAEEFPEGSKIFFLGEHAYGVAAQVSKTEEKDRTLSVILAFFPSDKTEKLKFKEIVEASQLPSASSSASYVPSYIAASQVSLSGRALSKITSSFMVITSDNQKHNLGLCLKYEAKALKVVGYTRKDKEGGRHWEYSQKALALIREYMQRFPEVFKGLEMEGRNGNGDMMVRADMFFGKAENPDAKVKEVKAWLKSKGVRDFEPVSLFCDQLDKVVEDSLIMTYRADTPQDTVVEIEKLADSYTSSRSTTTIKKAIVKGIPRQAVLKPSDAIYRLQGQQFALGDRVTMVKDSGGVPLAAKGTVIGLDVKSMDVVWDIPFMSGGTLGNRCSQYRGSTVEFNTCLNLSNPQFVTSTNPQAPPPPQNTNSPFKPRIGPQPNVLPAQGQHSASGWRPAPGPGPAAAATPMSIMKNPNRGARGGALYRGNRGGNPSNGHADHSVSPSSQAHVPPATNGAHSHPARGGFNSRSRGGDFGRGGFVNGSYDRGRGFSRGYNRGRGRGVNPTSTMAS